MKLLVDLGNSRLKWRWAGMASVGPAALDHRGRPAVDLVAALPEPPAPFTEIRMASVAGPILTARFAAALAARFGLVPRIAEAEMVAGRLRSGYRDPQQLGVDRWLAMRAALADDEPTGRCIIAAGTAFTLDLVDAAGQHAGGLIVPGLGLMEQALRGGTGNLARLASTDPAQADGDGGSLDFLVARATGEAMERGAAWALAALAIHHFDRLLAYEPGARLMVTGGDAPRLAPLLPAIADFRPDLVLEGLALDPFAGQPAPVVAE